jgi:hypothetical protein
MINNVSESASQSKYNNCSTTLYVYVYVGVYMSHTTTLAVGRLKTCPPAAWLKKTAIHSCYVLIDGLLDLYCVLEYCKVSV